MGLGGPDGLKPSWEAEPLPRLRPTRWPNGLRTVTPHHGCFVTRDVLGISGPGATLARAVRREMGKGGEKKLRMCRPVQGLTKEVLGPFQAHRVLNPSPELAQRAGSCASGLWT